MVEGIEVELVAGARSPQTQIVCVVCIVSWDWRVIGLGHHCLALDPIAALNTVFCIFFNSAVELDWIDDVTAFNLPRVTVFEPEIRDLDLAAILNHLLEDTIVVPDAVAPGRDL